MSQAIYPALPGVAIEVTRAPLWSTTSRQSVSMREYRTANASYPRYKYSLSYNVLRGAAWGYAEFATLVGFFNQRQGNFDSFLFTDDIDSSVTAASFGAGDGTTTQFQLVRSMGSFAEPVYDLNSAPLIYVGGVLQTLGTNYTVGSTGVITFVFAPAAAAALTWTGTYYRRCVFAVDTMEFNRFLADLWELKKVELISVKP